MKKTFVICCLLLVTSVLDAQVYVSFDVGYGNKGYSYVEQGSFAFNGDLPKGWDCYFAPKVGFAVSDEVSVGVQLGAGYSSYEYATGFYDPVQQGWAKSAEVVSDVLSATAKAFLRLRCVGSGRLSLHVEIAGGYGMGWGWDKKTEYRATDSWDIDMKRQMKERRLFAQVVPVANYAFSEHVGLDVYLNLVALTFGSTITERWRYGIKGYAADELPETRTKVQEFQVGVNALNTQLLTVGFNYRF